MSNKARYTSLTAPSLFSRFLIWKNSDPDRIVIGVDILLCILYSGRTNPLKTSVLEWIKEGCEAIVVIRYTPENNIISFATGERHMLPCSNGKYYKELFESCSAGFATGYPTSRNVASVPKWPVITISVTQSSPFELEWGKYSLKTQRWFISAYHILFRLDALFNASPTSRE